MLKKAMPNNRVYVECRHSWMRAYICKVGVGEHETRGRKAVSSAVYTRDGHMLGGHIQARFLWQPPNVRMYVLAINSIAVGHRGRRNQGVPSAENPHLTKILSCSS